jgi:glycine dehydrogenase subunit 2
MSTNMKLRDYHSAVWDEPVIMEMGHPGRRGIVFPEVDDVIKSTVGDARDLIPAAVRRIKRPALPELSEYEVLRHYLHLSQETLGMIGISLFGTCTMKYNPRVNEYVAMRRELAELHPHQDEETLQGVLAIIHDFDVILRELSGMDRFVFQAGGGADAAYTHACVTRAHHAARGELEQRNEIITTIQAHPCNAATAAAAGFKVVTLMLEENGYPSLDSLKAAVSNRTASLMVNNPDDLGIYNPEIKEWVRIVHEAGGLCFYDHANFNGVMAKIRARELGFDACMYMLHKTFGATKGGGPAVGAYGCAEPLATFLPAPIVTFDGTKYHLDSDRPHSVGKVREFWGNVPQVIKAYSWTRAMGAEGISEAADISVLASNYLEKKLLAIRGITKGLPDREGPRMEMTRYSLGSMKEETGVGVIDMQNRMVDFGLDAFHLAHEPWFVPEPFTPEVGELWSKEDIDYWLAVLARISDEAYSNPEIVKSAPHNQAVHRADVGPLEDPQQWAMTWRAFLKKQMASEDKDR